MWGGGRGSFLASGGTYLGRGWSKNGYFLGQYQAPMAGWFRGGDLTWKVFYEPYHPPMHRATLFRPILALSRYPPGPGVVQKLLFFGSKSGLYGGLVLGWRIPPRNCFVCHSQGCDFVHYTLFYINVSKMYIIYIIFYFCTLYIIFVKHVHYFINYTLFFKFLCKTRCAGS